MVELDSWQHFFTILGLLLQLGLSLLLHLHNIVLTRIIMAFKGGFARDKHILGSVFNLKSRRCLILFLIS